MGSIALWSVADSVETINPYVARNYVTRKHFSYFKFFIGDNVQRLLVTLFLEPRKTVGSQFRAELNS